MKPKAFTKEFPRNSEAQKWEAEQVAMNIMVIMSQDKGNEWNPPTYAEYKKRRLKDGEYTDSEEMFFNQVIPFFASEEKARTFSPAWDKI